MLPIVTSWLPPAMGISSAGLIDHFDPSIGLETDGDGQVVSWTNQADGERSTSGGSTVTVITGDGIPPLVRFDSGINSGALAYSSPGTEALTDGYAVFVVFRLNEPIADGNTFPRLWRGANDTHALFLRRSTGDMEVKPDPVSVALRPKSNYAAEYDLGDIAILTAWLTPTRQELYFNGKLVDFSKAVIGAYEIDGAVFEIGNSVRGDIGDILVYDSSATLADLNQSGSALAEKYGVSWKDIRPALIAVAENGLVDLFDPAFELSLNDNGEVAGWTNIADSSRSSGGSAHASRVVGPAGRPLIRFNSPEGSGHLSYPAPTSTLTEGYTVFVVARLSTRIIESWPAFPRLWRGANDAHALFLRRSTGNVEVKADPLNPALRPQRNYTYSEQQTAILTARLTSTSQELYFNGRLVDSSNAVIGAYELDEAVFEIGNSVRGEIGHILVYDATATLADLDVTGFALASAYATGWTRIAPEPEPGRLPAMLPVAAHRGNSSEAPENTLASIAAAVGLAGMVEFDTQVAADGTIVLMHDATVDRTTNGTGRVDEMPYENGLDELDAGSWFDPSFAGEPVPTLAEALTLAFDEGLVPVMEAKLPSPGDVVAYFEELERLDALDKVMLDSFNWDFLANFRRLSPQTKLGVLGIGNISEGLIDGIKELGADYLHWAHGSITQQEVDLVHANGLELIVWTVNNEARMYELLELGVDAITTDFPRVLDAVLREHARRSYSAWILEHAPDLPPEAQGFYDDPGGDGVANGLKYLFGTAPMVPGRMPVVTGDEDGKLSLHHSRNPSTIGAFLIYEWSSDLQHWHGSGEPDESGVRVDLLPTVFRKRAFPENDDIKVTAEVTGAPLSRLFLRASATQEMVKK